MAGFSSVTGLEAIMHADNCSFDGTNRGGAMTTNGQLWIGSTAAPHVVKGTITSPDSSVTIGYSSPNITLQVTGGTTVGKTITGNTGGALAPVAGNWFILGSNISNIGTPVQTNGSGNTLVVNIQRSSAIASTNLNFVGLAAFNSAEFSVDSNGFVSLKSGGFTWTDVTSATQTLAVQNGYLTDRGAGVTYTLPATASIGDEIRIVGKLGLATITPNANQQILMSSASGTVGATGTAVATNVGDCIDLICTTSGASTVWRAANFVGNWTLN
jgi:hypothetical protein